MTEKWLEDHLGFLVNHFLSLIQTEVDRYQETCRLLKDYYVAMEGGPGPEKGLFFQQISLLFFFIDFFLYNKCLLACLMTAFTFRNKFVIFFVCFY